MKQNNHQSLELQKIRNQLFLEYVDKIVDFDGYYLNSSENKISFLSEEEKKFVLDLLDNVDSLKEEDSQIKKIVANYLIDKRFNKGRFNNLRTDDQKFVLETIDNLSKERQQDAQEIISNYLFYLNHYGIYDQQDISRLKSLLKHLGGIEDNNQIAEIAKLFEDYIKSKDIEYLDQEPSKTALFLYSLMALSNFSQISIDPTRNLSKPKANEDNNNPKLVGDSLSSGTITSGNIYDILSRLIPTLPTLLPVVQAKSVSKATSAEIEKNNKNLTQIRH